MLKKIVKTQRKRAPNSIQTSFCGNPIRDSRQIFAGKNMFSTLFLPTVIWWRVEILLQDIFNKFESISNKKSVADIIQCYLLYKVANCSNNFFIWALTIALTMTKMCKNYGNSSMPCNLVIMNIRNFLWSVLIIFMDGKIQLRFIAIEWKNFLVQHRAAFISLIKTEFIPRTNRGFVIEILKIVKLL